MDVWIRLDRLVRSWTRAYHDGDPDLDDAWDELERYLQKEMPRSSAPAGNRRTLPREIRQAFHDLELPEGSDLETVRRSYRQLLLRYHPDRHEGNPDVRSTAVEITQRLSLAYQRIASYYYG